LLTAMVGGAGRWPFERIAKVMAECSHDLDARAQMGALRADPPQVHGRHVARGLGRNMGRALR